MTTNLHAGEVFPDFKLPDHRKKPRRLSRFTEPSPMDEKLGFEDGYPLILIFGRGFFCPRDQQHMRQLVRFQDELAVNFGKLVTVSTDAPLVGAAFRAGLGAWWPFLSDEKREVIERIGILDETEGEYAYVARPYTFVLRPDLTIHKVYDGWFFVGRPTLEELRHDLREIMRSRSDYRYEAHNTPEAKKIRIPQQEWANGVPPLGTNGLPVAQGVVRSFDIDSGNGEIESDASENGVFFNCTAIPGEGYRTLRPGTPVSFELVENETGPTARNVQTDGESQGEATLRERVAAHESSAMPSVAVFSGKPDSIHIPDGRGVLIEALRVGVDVTDKETGAARYGGAPNDYEAETPERVAREAVETRTVNREHAPDGRIDVRDGSFRNGYLCRSWQVGEELLITAVDYLRLTVEAIGAAVVGIGALPAALRYTLSLLGIRKCQDSEIRLHLGRFLVLGLEFQLAADILGTAVAPTFEEVQLLAAIVVIRTVLNCFLSKELERDQAPPNPEQD